MNVIIRNVIALCTALFLTVTNGTAQEGVSVRTSPLVVVAVDVSIGSAWYEETSAFFSALLNIPDISSKQKGVSVELEYRLSRIVSLITDAGYHQLSLSQEAWHGPTIDLFGNRLVEPTHYPAWRDETWYVSTALAARFRTSTTDPVAATFDLGCDYRFSSDRDDLHAFWPRFTAGISIRPSGTPSSIRIFGGSAHGALLFGIQYGFGVGGVFP